MEINFTKGKIFFEGSEAKVFDDFSLLKTADYELQFTEEKIGHFQKISIYILPQKKIVLSDFQLHYSIINAVDNGVFCNGFQSWTDSRIFNKKEKISKVNAIIKPICKHYSDYEIFNYSGKTGIFHSWNYSYFRLDNGKVFFIGGINEDDAYTLITTNLTKSTINIAKNVKGWAIDQPTLLCSFFYGEDLDRKCFDQFYTFLNRDYPKVTQAAGWTSWYHYYEKITEQIIIDNLHAIKKQNIPITFFQIDDGYQAKTGDWLETNEKFPNGMQYLAEQIKEKGYQAGLWLAPFICSKKSKICIENPDWLLRNEDGKPIKMGYNPAWDGWFYGLDIYHPKVVEYLKKVFDTVLNVWGFDLVKLDFLFAAASFPRDGKTIGRIMADGMILLRTLVGDKLILGCGVPLIPAFGRVDYCRIGPDIHLSWDFKLLKWTNNRERPSNFNAIGNAINRHEMSHRGFLNDPDVFILRKEKNKLTFLEKYSLLLANVLFGDLIFTSDNIDNYDSEMLRLFKSIFPLQKPQDIKVSVENHFYKCSFRIGDRYYLAFFNLSNSSKRIKLPKGLFFNGESEELTKGDQMLTLKAHQSVCLFSIGLSPFAIAGTKGHLFPGCEIENIYLVDDTLKLDFKKDTLFPITVYIKIPNEYEIDTINEVKATIISKKDYKILKVLL